MDKKNKEWEDFKEDVKPLKNNNNRFFKKQIIKKRDLNNFNKELKELDESKEDFLMSNNNNFYTNKNGFDKNLLKKIKKGTVSLEAYLDLHGIKYKTAKEMVYDFILSSHKKGLRLVLIITGKGKRLNIESGWKGSGILKEDLPKWLRCEALSSKIIYYDSAPAKYGGTGATLLYLKKSTG